MRNGLKAKFERLWGKYFPGADLPICFYYAAEPGDAESVKAPAGHRCFIADLARVRSGESLVFHVGSIGCFGGKRYLGFSQELMPNFEHFLSCGIPGKLEGERYKKSPELVRAAFGLVPSLKAPAPFVVFKRWDNLAEADEPEVVIFFAPPDVLSGLFTLANFDEPEPHGVIAPMGAGCATIVQYPYLQGQAEHPRAVLGLFDVSARPCVSPSLLTFGVPMSKFVTMVGNMEESFLITPSWAKVSRRISRLKE
jgi:uncharacterized protein (DUF169 family)